MERNPYDPDVIELGIASIETRGQPIPTLQREDFGYVYMGLCED